MTSRGLTSMELASFQLQSMDKFGPISIVKNIAVFSAASLFRVLALSILGVFFKVWALLIMAGYLLVLAVCLGIRACCCNFSFNRRQFGECLLMSWLTITNLERGRTAALLRIVSTLYWTIAHTITLSVILRICHTDPGIVNIEFDNPTRNTPVTFINWSELPLAQDLTTLNILLVSTLCLGWGSLVLDVITAAVKYHYRSRSNTEDQEEEVSFWEGAILLEGLKY